MQECAPMTIVPFTGELFGPRIESRESLSARLANGVSRLMRQRRLERLIGSDPLALDPRVQPTRRALGYSHVYAADDSGEVERWLQSPACLAAQAPVDVCQRAMDQFHRFLETGSEVRQHEFLATVTKLLEMGHHTELDGRACFVIPHVGRVDGYAPHSTTWLNARAQGWAGSLFARAHQVGGDVRFADAAVCAVRPCMVTIERGGVRDREHTGELFYEKHALAGQTRHVLSGFLSALLAIWDVARATGDRDAHSAFDEGVAALRTKVLSSFDNGTTSLYDQSGDRRTTSRGVIYTWIHARQLLALSRITHDKRFVRWAERWGDYSTSPTHRMIAMALSPGDPKRAASEMARAS
ncbi:MAG: D-glucuronyl C5-epimerase [Myxococcales bacterium]|nr:D-glucuronyl C5-epimerase [Myxococcales bacterium]